MLWLILQYNEACCPKIKHVVILQQNKPCCDGYCSKIKHVAKLSRPRWSDEISQSNRSHFHEKSQSFWPSQVGRYVTLQYGNRRFPRSMRSQGERPGCGSHVKRVDTEMLSTHDVALRNVDGSLFHVQISFVMGHQDQNGQN